MISDFEFEPERWRTVTPRQQGLYRATMALMLSQRPLDFHTAAPLTLELIRAAQIDDHHVFPRAYLRDIGRGAEPDSILNHALIDRETNIRIGQRPPSRYLGEIQEALGDSVSAILTSQTLPTGEHSALSNDDFDGLLTWRIEALTELLHQSAGSVGTLPKALAPHLRGLDARVEQIELGLRAAIEATLTRAQLSLPGHLQASAIERLRAAQRKQPGAEPADRRSLSTQLQYLDLRELQEAITNKAAWPLFERRFLSKGAIADRFNQLAELRNGLRHSRDVTPIVIKDGEAALMWFTDALNHAPPEGSDSKADQGELGD